jgi:hypothetical protein
MRFGVEPEVELLVDYERQLVHSGSRHFLLHLSLGVIYCPMCHENPSVIHMFTLRREFTRFFTGTASRPLR